jgi:hypothetical protein
VNAATLSLVSEDRARNHGAGLGIDAARRWAMAFRALFMKELRDLAWLACGVAVAGALLVVGAGALFDFVLASFTPSTWPTWCALGALAALPLAAEVLCADGRTGTARRAQAWPTPSGAALAAKAGALASCAALLIAVWLTASAMAPGARTRMPFEMVQGVLPLVVPTALFTTLLVAAVTGHSLAALLAGLATGGMLAVFLDTGFFTPTLVAGRFEYWIKSLLAYSWSPITLGIAVLCIGWIHARRGPAARSVVRRALRASSCVGAFCLAQFALDSPRWFVTPRLAFDDPGAEVMRFHPSPDGRRVAVELFHRPSFCTTWWLVDAVGATAPRRVSTPEVTRATGLGTAWQVELLDWSVDGTVLVGASMRGSAHTSIQSQSWTIDPETLAVDYLPGRSEQQLLGWWWIERQSTRESTAEAPREVWKLSNGRPSMTLSVSEKLGQARRALGIAFYMDRERRVHRVDLVAGEDLSTDVVLEESEKHPQFSDDGRWMVRKRASGLELVELPSGRARAVPGKAVLQYTSRVRNQNGWALWTKRPEPLVIDVSDGDGHAPKRWRLVGLDSEREFSVPHGHTPPFDLDGTHWLVCCVDHRRIELLDADGNVLRTLREPREEVRP